MYTESPLGEKLRKQLVGRGEELHGIRASSTEELVHRAEMGRDPNVNCSEQAFREVYGRRDKNGNAANNRRNDAANVNAQQNRGRTVSSGGAPRDRSGVEARDKSREKNMRINTGVNRGRQTNRFADRQALINSSSVERNMRFAEPVQDVEVIDIKKKKLQPIVCLSALLVVIAVIFIVMTLAEKNTHDKNVEILEKQLEAGQEELEELKTQLADKNDIRKIEEIAVNELGMVKEDSLQRRYITLDEENEVEIYDDGEDTASGVMLDGMFSAMSEFFERYK